MNIYICMYIYIYITYIYIYSNFYIPTVYLVNYTYTTLSLSIHGCEVVESDPPRDDAAEEEKQRRVRTGRFFARLGHGKWWLNHDFTKEKGDLAMEHGDFTKKRSVFHGIYCWYITERTHVTWRILWFIGDMTMVHRVYKLKSITERDLTLCKDVGFWGNLFCCGVDKS